MIPIFYHDIVTPSGHPGDEVISALQKFIRRGETELVMGPEDRLTDLSST